MKTDLFEDVKGALLERVKSGDKDKLLIQEAKGVGDWWDKLPGKRKQKVVQILALDKNSNRKLFSKLDADEQSEIEAYFKKHKGRVESVEGKSLSEEGHHYFDGKDYYADTAFMNSIRGIMPGMEMKHLGFGEFYLAGPQGEVQFDRMRGKDFPGQSGRSHKLYDNKKGALVKQLIKAMEKKKKSKLVKEDVDLEEGCKTPGMKKRSKGKGRGLAKGKGKGPFGVPIGDKDEDVDLDEEVRAGQYFVIVDISVPGGKLVRRELYRSVKGADKVAAKLNKQGRNVQVLDAMWYEPARAIMKAQGMIGEDITNELRKCVLGEGAVSVNAKSINEYLSSIVSEISRTKRDLEKKNMKGVVMGISDALGDFQHIIYELGKNKEGGARADQLIGQAKKALYKMERSF